MITRSQKEEKVVFGLDIGTRSVVGTIGYQQENKFHVMAQKVKLHETRAMLDGQIHDIAKVSSTILSVKEELERETGIELTDVCIAAAGRVLRTVQALYEEEYEEEKNITQEDIYHLESRAVEAAYAEFMQKYKSDEKFFLVGYTVRHFYMNGAPIVNLEGHNLLKAGVDVIATFLPQDVVDGLYTACEREGLHVANLTLEPIAAIRVAIPEKFRSLNMALIDVGAGTSDICVTSEGTIIAYGMIPEAGDHLTEIIAQNYQVDFHTADQIKIEGSTKPTVTFYDVMGRRNSEHDPYPGGVDGGSCDRDDPAAKWRQTGAGGLCRRRRRLCTGVYQGNRRQVGNTGRACGASGGGSHEEYHLPRAG